MARAAGNPKRWRKRAAKIRDLAERIWDPATKAAMLRLADDYDRRAEEAEERVRRGA
jgi:hypothetical protein